MSYIFYCGLSVDFSNGTLPKARQVHPALKVDDTASRLVHLIELRAFLWFSSASSTCFPRKTVTLVLHGLEKLRLTFKRLFQHFHFIFISLAFLTLELLCLESFSVKLEFDFRIFIFETLYIFRVLYQSSFEEAIFDNNLVSLICNQILGSSCFTELEMNSCNVLLIRLASHIVNLPLHREH